YIERDALAEPERHIKIRRRSNGRRQSFEKPIIRDISYDKLFEAKKIIVKNASGTQKANAAGIDMIALRLIYKLFYEYQDSGIIPEHISLYF
ncbi:hypothetical protein, partial [Butyricicoccus sp.]|uniref:hypothetical protein n=1 Tax=Butyricicoccus sp. TaxID=2049021 RepID=UPI003F151DE7